MLTAVRAFNKSWRVNYKLAAMCECIYKRLLRVYFMFVNLLRTDCVCLSGIAHLSIEMYVYICEVF